MLEAKAESRRNPVSGSTVIISLGRQKALEQLRRIAPRDWSHANPKLVSGEECPFCPGHEHMTPPEVKAYRPEGTLPDTPGWSVRAFQNKFSALDYNFPGVMIAERQVGQFLTTEGFGCHYVVAETPDHVAHMADYPLPCVRDVVQMWRDMTHLIAGDRNVKYVSIFRNFGPMGGASQPHPHSQVIGMPFIPPRNLNEYRGTERYYADNKECFYCREIETELKMGVRIIEQSENFVAWCPYISKTPYQIVISPHGHQSYFANVSTYNEADHLLEFSVMLQRNLKRMRSVLNDPDFVTYIHTAPANQPEMPYYHWHCHIDPITTAIQAGLEKGSGLFLNPRSPESAAEDLRAAVIVPEAAAV